MHVYSKKIHNITISYIALKLYADVCIGLFYWYYNYALFVSM